jgi:hypothetical protein
MKRSIAGIGLACLWTLPGVASAAITPVEARVDLFTAANAAGWPESNVNYVQDSCFQGAGPNFGTAVGNPPGSLGCSTSAESVVDDTGVIRRVQGEAQI